MGARVAFAPSLTRGSVPVRVHHRRGVARPRAMSTSPLFDAGVPLEELPWGKVGESAVASRTFPYNDGATALEAYLAWDPEALRRAGGGLPGVLVAHTAIGPQEVFIQSCCDALARLGYAALALDLFGAGACVFDKARRDAILNPLRENRAANAARTRAGYDALTALAEVDASLGVCAVGFCLGGQAVLDLARAKSARHLRGVVSVHGSLDHPPSLASPSTSEDHPAATALLLHGTEDPFNPPERVRACVEGLRDAGVEHRLVEFEGAMHGFTRPEKVTPSDRDAGFGYDDAAARRSWEMIEAFLEARGSLEAV